MMNNPTPTTKGTKPAVQTVRSVPVKRDINLISNRESQERLARRILFIIAGVVFLIGFAYFAFYLPLIAGKLLEATAQSIDQQIGAYSSTDEEFTKLTGQIRSLKTMSDSLKASAEKNKNGYEYLKMIESACPGTIRLTDINLNPSDVTLSGVAASDNDVAQLVVNMQSYPDFAQVTVTSVAPAVAASADPSAAPTAPGSTILGRAFIIVASFPAPASEASAAPMEAPSASPESNGGSGT